MILSAQINTLIDEELLFQSKLKLSGTPVKIELRSGDNPFKDRKNTLTPRQQLTPSPYAIYAEGANAAGINGTLPAAALGGTYSNAVTFNNGADTFDGTFVGQFFVLHARYFYMDIYAV